MIQTITGPRGMVAYLKDTPNKRAQFPELDPPCRAFVRYGGFAHNANHAPSAQTLPRQLRPLAAIAMFGCPAPRRNA